MNYFADWCIEQHKKTNHFYDDYLPYEFHLRMVHNVFLQFSHLLDDKISLNKSIHTLRSACENAVWGHDLIEDCRISYNDICIADNAVVAEIIFAVTNEKGRNRAERANSNYYDGIRKTKGAIFVKLCDRIANVQYSKLTKSKMFQKYQQENDNFIEQLGEHEYGEMVNYLSNLII